MSQTMTDWKETTLWDVVKIKYWKDHKKLEDWEYPCYWSWWVMRKVDSFLSKDPSVLIPRKWTLTNLFYVTHPFRTVDTLFYTLIDQDLADPYYLYCLLSSLNLADLNVWSAVPSLTTNVLNQLPLNLPPLPEQKAIASVLSSFDDKIELLREQNLTLEKIAQTLFKEWFGKYSVDRPEELPEGWRVGVVSEECDINIWRTPPRKESERFRDKQPWVKWISIKDIWNSWVYIFNTSEYLTEDAVEKFRVPIIPVDTVILSFKMTVWKITITTEKMLSNEAIAHFNIRDESNLSKEYIYSHLENLDFNSLWSTSSIVTAINSSIIKNMSLIIPSDKVITEYTKVIQPVFKKIKLNTQEIQSLSKTRDALLPKLMSGKVRVRF